jgi:hypothetical protein
MYHFSGYWILDTNTTCYLGYSDLKSQSLQQCQNFRNELFLPHRSSCEIKKKRNLACIIMLELVKKICLIKHRLTWRLNTNLSRTVSPQCSHVTDLCCFFLAGISETLPFRSLGRCRFRLAHSLDKKWTVTSPILLWAQKVLSLLF